MPPDRRYCLEDALRPIRFTRAADQITREMSVSEISVEGVWGGTLASDRRAVAGIPTEEAADLMEQTSTERLERPILARGDRG